MTKQKKGLLLFICSLIPGAGEMYMGFFKQGISIMLMFWGTVALATLSALSFIIMLLPIMWCYSFFHVHNLKSMSEDDFYAVEDSYLLHIDQFIGNADHFVKKYRKLIAAFLIIFGISILWDNLTGLIWWLLPDGVANVLMDLFYNVPSIIIALAIIAAGIHMLNTKKQELDSEETSEKPRKEEHYWEPYRPYQQSQEETSEAPTAEALTPEASEQTVVSETSSTDETDAQTVTESAESAPASEEASAGTEKTN